MLVISASCSRKVYVPVERVVVTADSVMKYRVMRDSIVIRDSVETYSRGDTVVRREVRWRDRVALVTDTLWRVRRDTVRIEKAVAAPGSAAGIGAAKWSWLIAAGVAALVGAVVFFRQGRR